MTAQKDSLTFTDALALYEAAERPPLCPRCGGWDGPRVPFCTDRGHNHRATCTRYTFGLDLCSKCDEHATPTGQTT